MLLGKIPTFQCHVSKVVTKCTGMLIALNHAKHVIPHTTLKRLVSALVFATMRYCMLVYGICGQTQKQRIQKLVNLAARVLSGRRRHEHVADVIRQAGWLGADQLVEYHRIMAVHRLMVHQLPVPLVRTIGPPAAQLHQHNTRGADRRVVPWIRTEAGRRRLDYSGVMSYNTMCDQLGGKVNKIIVKKHVKTFQT